MKYPFLMASITLFLLSNSGTAFADKPANVGHAIGNCQVSDVQVTTFQRLDDSDPVHTLPVPANASDCIGAFDRGNVYIEGPKGDNLGYDEDGWLNNENYQGWWTGPGAFVDNSDLLDLDGDGQVDDPGWVYVGKRDGEGYEAGTSSDGNTSYTFIEDLIKFDECKDKHGNSVTDCYGGQAVSGKWSYNPPAMNPDELIELLGGEFFDQVAIMFKAGNAFAMYNFSVEALGLDPVFAGDYNYAFTGTWDISDVLGGAGLSHFSFWARDPISDTVTVPEPSTWMLMLLPTLLLLRRKR